MTPGPEDLLPPPPKKAKDSQGDLLPPPPKKKISDGLNPVITLPDSEVFGASPSNGLSKSTEKQPSDEYNKDIVSPYPLLKKIANDEFEVRLNAKIDNGSVSPKDLEYLRNNNPEKYNKIAKDNFPESGDAFLKSETAAKLLAQNINKTTNEVNFIASKYYDADYYANLDKTIVISGEQVNKSFEGSAGFVPIKPTKVPEESKSQLKFLAEQDRVINQQMNADKIVNWVDKVQAGAHYQVSQPRVYDVTKMSDAEIEATKNKSFDLYNKLITAKQKVLDASKKSAIIHQAIAPIQSQLGSNLLTESKAIRLPDPNKDGNDYVRSIGEELYKTLNPDKYALFQAAGGYDKTKPYAEQIFESSLDKINKEIMTLGYNSLRGDVAANGTDSQYANIYDNLKYLDYKFSTPKEQETKHMIAAALKNEGISPSSATDEQKDRIANTLPLENQQVWYNKTKASGQTDLPDTGFLYSVHKSGVRTMQNILKSGSIASPISWATLFLGVPSNKEKAQEILMDEMVSNVLGENPESLQRYTYLRQREKNKTLTPNEQLELNDLSQYTDVRTGWDRFKDGNGNMVGMMAAITVDALPTLGGGVISKGIVGNTGRLVEANAAEKGIADIPLLEDATEKTVQSLAQRLNLPRDAESIINFAKNKNEMFVLMHHDNAKKAMELFPDDDAKKSWYTGITDVISVALPNILPTHKLGQLFNSETKSVVADLVSKLDVDNLDKAVVDNLMKKTATDIIEKSGTFLYGAEKAAAETSLTMSLMTLGNNITQAVLKPDSISGQDIADNFTETFSSTFLDSQLVGLIGGHGAVQKKYGQIGVDAIYDATNDANSINSVKYTILDQKSKGELTDQQANSKISILNTATELRQPVNDLQRQEGLTPNAAKRVFINLLNERILKANVKKLEESGASEALIKPSENRIEEINRLNEKIIGKEIYVNDDYSIVDKETKLKQDAEKIANTPKQPEEKVFTDFDKTLFHEGKLTELGQQIKDRIAKGEDVTVLTSREDTPENREFIAKTLGIPEEKIKAGLDAEGKAAELTAYNGKKVFYDDNPDNVAAAQKTDARVIDTGLTTDEQRVPELFKELQDNGNVGEYLNPEKIPESIEEIQGQALTTPAALKGRIGEKLTLELIARNSVEDINKAIESWTKKVSGEEVSATETKEADRHISLLEKGLEEKANIHEQLKTETNDSQNIEGVSGEKRIGEETVQAESDKSAGASQTGNSGVVQKQRQEEIAHKENIQNKFRKEFENKGVPSEQVDAALALMDARAKSWASEEKGRNAEQWYERVSDIKSGEFEGADIKYQGGKLKAAIIGTTAMLHPVDYAKEGRHQNENTKDESVKESSVSKEEFVPLIDTRKIDQATGVAITDKNNLSLPDIDKNGVSVKLIQDITRASNKYGVDPFTALAISLQETNLANRGEAAGENPFHILFKPTEDTANMLDPVNHAVELLKQKLELAERKGKETEAEKLQAWNGYGKVGKDTEGHQQSLYGIDVSKEPIDMSKNPVYGKRIIDLRDNVIKKNPELVRIVEAERKNIAFQEENGIKKGALETLADGKIVIHALESPDFSTMVHEIGHAFEGDLTEKEKKIVENFGGSEKFARGFEKYLRDGDAPTPELKTLFDKFKQWLTDIYQTLKGSPIDKKLSPEIKQIFDRLLTESSNESTIRKNIEDAAAGEKSAKAKNDAMEAEASKHGELGAKVLKEINDGKEPPNPPTDTTKKEEKPERLNEKALANKLVNAKGTPEVSKEGIKAEGLEYEPKSQKESQDLAKSIVDELGMDEAVLQAQAGKFGGDVNTFVQTEALERLAVLEDVESDAIKKQEFALRYAEIGIGLDKSLRKQGQGISAINHFYKKSPLGIQLIENAKRKEDFERWAKPKEQSWKEAFAEMMKEPEFEEQVKEYAKEEMKKERAENRKARAKKVDEFFDKAKEQFKGGAAYSTIIPPKVITAALEGMKQAYHAGENVVEIVQKAIDYISEQLGHDNWDKDRFRNEWQEKLKDSSKKKLTDEEVKAKILDRFRNKLKGLTDRQKEDVVRKSFQKIVENGGLDYADFRSIISEVTGRGEMTDAEAAKLRELVKQTNAVDEAGERARTERTPESRQAFREAEIKAGKASKELNTLLYNRPNITKRLTSLMQLNTLGIPALINNPIYNVVNQLGIRTPVGLVKTGIDAAIYGVAKAFGKEVLPETNILSAQVQREFFRKLGLGTRESVGQFLTGLNRMDYINKEIQAGQQIRPATSIRDLWAYSKGEKNLTKKQVLDKIIQASPPGITAEIIARTLNLGDKPQRFAAEGAQAAAFAKSLGLKDIDYDLFIDFPREEAYRAYKLKGLSDAEAAKKADYIKDTIVKEGERSTFQQDNMLNDALSKVFGGKGSGVGELIKATVISPYIKIPTNAYWSYYNIVNPEVAMLQSMIYAAKAAIKNQTGKTAFSFDKTNSSAAKDLNEAKYWFAHAAVGMATRAVIVSLVGAGIFRPANTGDDTKKEREGEQFYENQGTLNVSKLAAWMKGEDPNKVKNGLVINNRWFGHWGTVGNTIARKYEDMTPEQKANQSEFWDAAIGGMELYALQDFEQGVFGNTSTLLSAMNQGIKTGDVGYGIQSWGVNTVNMFTNIIHPAASAQIERAVLPYYTKQKADTFIGELKNSLLTRSALLRNLTGEYPPSKTGIWGDRLDKKDNWVMNLFGISHNNPDNFAQPIYEDYKKTNNTKFFPPAVQPVIIEHGQRVKLSADDASKLEQLVGHQRKALIAPYINNMAKFQGSNKTYSQLNEDEKLDKLRILYEEGYNNGKYLFLQQNPKYKVPEPTKKENQTKEKESDANETFRAALKAKSPIKK